MAIRIYRAPQAGVGTYEDPIRSILNELIDIHAGDSFDERDNPARKYSVCTVSASQSTHDAIIADGRSTPLTPIIATDYAHLNTILDSPFSSFQSNWRDIVSLRLEQDGISVSWLSGSNTLRDMIRYLLRIHTFSQIVDGQGNANIKSFITNNLDTTIGNVPATIRNAVKNWMQDKGLATGWINNSATVRQVIHFIVENLGFGKIRFAGTEF